MIVSCKIDLNNPKELTEEQLKEIRELEKMSDDEIDFSDIPEQTHEDFKHFERVNEFRKHA